MDILLPCVNDLSKIKELSNTYDMTKTFDDGSSLMHWVSAYGNSDVLDFLVHQGCNINSATPTGYRPIHEACAFNKQSNVHYLLSLDHNQIFAKSNNGCTILHEICKYDSYDVLQYLMKFYPDDLTKINVPNKNGKLPKDMIKGNNIRLFMNTFGLM